MVTPCSAAVTSSEPAFTSVLSRSGDIRWPSEAGRISSKLKYINQQTIIREQVESCTCVGKFNRKYLALHLNLQLKLCKI
jgi:hypothetical protein